MKLYLKCPSCKYENSFKSDVATRVEYTMKNGKTKELNCKECHKKTTIHINRIYAKESKLAYLLAGSIFLIGSIIVLIFWSKFLINSHSSFGSYAVGLFLIVPVWVYVVIHNQNLMRIRTFNRAYVREEF